MNTMTSQEKTLAVRERYEDLPPASKQIVDDLVKKLIKGFKAKAATQPQCSDVKFGRDSALEVIFALRDAMDYGTIRLKDN